MACVGADGDIGVRAIRRHDGMQAIAKLTMDATSRLMYPFARATITGRGGNLKNLQGSETLEGEEEELDQGILPELISRQTRITHLAIFRLAEHSLNELGITPQQFALLVVVQRNPGSRQSLLAKARGLDKSTLVPMIDRLERDGHVERRALATDRRIKTIWVTPRGEEVLERAIPLIRALDDRIGAHLAPEERAELLRLLEKIRRGIGEE